MKKTVMLVKGIGSGYERVVNVCDVLTPEYHAQNGNIQLSEVMEIEFTELDKQVVTDSQVAAIDRQITKVIAENEATLISLNDQKQKLLCITHEVE